MEKRKILIVDDEIHYIVEMKEALHSDYSIFSAYDGKEALKLYHKENFLVVITDLKMPTMDGFQLVESFEQLENPPVVIVQSIIDDLKSVVNLMQKGVYDYILKPINRNELTVRVKNAFEVAELRNLRKITEKEREIRIAYQFNKFSSIPINDPEHHKYENVKLDPILAELVQNNGFSLLSYFVELISGNEEINSEKYHLNQELLDVMINNSRAVQNIKNILSEIEYVRENPFKLEKVAVSEFVNTLNALVTKNAPITSIKDQELEIISGFTYGVEDFLLLHPKYFSKAIQEILYNACKFSKKNSNISILIEDDQDKLKISIINIMDSSLSTHQGIEEEFSRLIFEPFFRLSKESFPKYPTQDLGLGLTLVEKIIQNHNGTISIANMLPENENRNEKWIKAKIKVPIYKNKI
ncbi:MAG: response regulator [Leptospiraceae bacterium]|nr:response regulator [Leptospiraceae bacterium]